MFGGKCVAQSVDQKLLQRRQIRTVLHFRSMQKMALYCTLNAGMDLRSAHPQRVSQLGIRRTPRTIRYNFEHDKDILRFKCHNIILYSRIANSKWQQLLQETKTKTAINPSRSIAL